MKAPRTCISSQRTRARQSPPGSWSSKSRASRPSDRCCSTQTAANRKAKHIRVDDEALAAISVELQCRIQIEPARVQIDEPFGADIHIDARRGGNAARILDVEIAARERCSRLFAADARVADTDTNIGAHPSARVGDVILHGGGDWNHFEAADPLIFHVQL